MEHHKYQRSKLLQWVFWFFLLNSFLFLIIIFSYFDELPNFSLITQIGWLGKTLTWIFFISAFLTQWVILFFLASLIPILLVLLWPKRWLTFILSMIFAAAIGFFIIGDSFVYKFFHIHYVNVAIEAIQAHVLREVIPLTSKEFAYVLIIFFSLFILEFGLGLFIWKILKNKRIKYHWVYSCVLLGVVLISYGLMYTATSQAAWVNQETKGSILKAAHVAPNFKDFYSVFLSLPLDREIKTKNGNAYLQVEPSIKTLHYPLQPLQCTFQKNPPNILFIVIDTWRADAFNATVTPNIARFSQKTLQFNDHWSGGNCTKPGVFSLFYALPPNYWSSFLNAEKGPVWIDVLNKANYTIKILTSAALNFPAFDKTIFKNVKDLTIKTAGNNAVERDNKITQEFINFLQTKSSKPFFSFLFYDAAHNYCDPHTPHQTPFPNAISLCNRVGVSKEDDPKPYMQRYLNAVYSIDQQVHHVLSALETQHLLKNTIVVITADHGEEINDNHSGYWEHSSAYDVYQLKVPFLLYWPGHKVAQINYLTTHYDVVPTLLSLLGCTTEFKSYSVGQSLFQKGHRPFFIAGSYGDYAIVTDKNALRVRASGDYAVEDFKAKFIPTPLLDRNVLQGAFEQLNRFYH